MVTLQDMSVREKNLWGELLVDVVVALYYFPSAIKLLMRPEGEAITGELAGLVAGSIALGIVLGIVVFGLINLRASKEPVDERDHLFMAHGSRAAYGVLVACLCLLMWQVAASELSHASAGYFPFKLTPVAISHLLLLSVILSSTVKAVVQLVYYRRGY